MRNVDKIADRLNTTLQTKDNNANPSTFLRIRRYNIPLHEKPFIEKSRIVNREGLTDSDIAVCHPYFGRDNTEMWVAYVRQGTLHIKYANNHEVMTRSEWNDYSFTADADSCAIAFDSVAKHNVRGQWEFITDEYPWVFWTDNGALYCKMCTPLGVHIITLAEHNVTDVSAVRGPSGEYGNWNLGLTVFFLMGGDIYYRQYINGEWCDAELIQISGLNNLSIAEIKAFNTWDYRVGLQILDSNGDLYLLFSYTEGIGVKGTEHVEISDISANVVLNGVTYYDTKEVEHIQISDISAYVRMIVGNSATPISTENTSGTQIQVTFDLEQTAENLLPSMFELEDNNGNYYYCSSASVSGEILTLVFDDFDRSNGDTLTLTYTKPTSGGLLSPSCQTESFVVEFTPVGLVTPTTPQPTYGSGANSDDMTFEVTFTEDIINDTLMGDLRSHFGVEVSEYEYVPLGSLETTYRTIASVTRTGTDTLQLVINTPNFSSAIGTIKVTYDGYGGLKGDGGMVKAFEGTFTPTGLTWKGHQNDVEHIRLTDISASVTVRTITYYSTMENEHLEISDIVASITLINIHDI